jgi:hypothetical protein
MFMPERFMLNNYKRSHNCNTRYGDQFIIIPNELTEIYEKHSDCR